MLPSSTKDVTNAPDRSRYDAFFSYSHAADRKLAPALQNAVERFATPWNQRRSLRVFRDKTGLAASSGLWSAIERELAQATWFVLLASPDAANSRWVGREVSWWLEHRGPQSLLIVVTSGTAAWDEQANRFTATSDAIPPVLHAAYPEEPQWVDLRPACDAGHLDPRAPTFGDAVADIAAALRDLPKDQLIGQDIRHLRRSRRLAWSAASLLTVLALAATALAIVANTQRSAALAAQQLVVARAMLNQAETRQAQDPRASLRFGAAALRLVPSLDTRNRLARIVLNSPYLGATSGQQGTLPGLAISPDGTTLATGSADGSVMLWTLDGRSPPQRIGGALRGALSTVNSVAIDPTGTTLAVAGIGAGPDVGAELWDIADRAHPRLLGGPLTGHLGGVNVAKFARNATLLVTSGVNDGAVIFWDLTALGGPRPVGPPLVMHRGGMMSFDISPDGRLLAAASVDGTASLWNIADLAHPVRLAAPLGERQSLMLSVRFDPTGTVLAMSGRDRRILLWDVTNPAAPNPRGTPITGLRGPVTDLAFAVVPNPVAYPGKPVSSLVLAGAGGDGATVLWDVTDPARTPQAVKSFAGHNTTVLRVVFAPTGAAVVTAGGDGSAIVWDLTAGVDQGERRSLADHTGAVSWVGYSPDGTLLASTGRDGAVVVRDVTATQQQPVVFPGDTFAHPTGAAFLDDGRRLVLGMSNGEVRVVPTGGGDVARLDARHVGLVAAVAVGSQGLLATGSTDGTVTLWDARDSAAITAIGNLPGDPLSGMTAAAFVGDGSTLLVAGSGRATRLTAWDVHDPTSPRRLPDPPGINADSITTLAVARRAAIMATGSVDHSIVLWSLTDPSAPVPIGAPIQGLGAAVSALALSPDGRTLFASSVDGTSSLFDLTDPARPALLGAQSQGFGFATTAAFSPSSPQRAFGGQDRTVTVVDYARTEEVRRDPAARACQRASGPLDAPAWENVAPGTNYQDTCQ